MIALKIIHTPFNSRNLSSLHQPTYDRKLCNLPLCRSKSEGSSSGPKGDLQKQELLAKIAMLQAEKLRVSDYLDDRSEYLTKYAEEANAEFEAVGESALKDLDEATARIMENIESRMQAFEESSELNKQEIAKWDKEMADFESAVQKGRNEGMFFQSLGDKAPVDKAMAKEEAEKITEVTKQIAASSLRRNVYLALIGLLSLGIADSFLAPSPNVIKVAVLGAIWVGLISQYSYEQKLISENEQKLLPENKQNAEKGNDDKGKK